MSGEVSGLQQLIHEKQTLAFYTHCTGHVLNLAISRSCNVPHICNYIPFIKVIIPWIKFSLKRSLLKAICEAKQQSVS